MADIIVRSSCQSSTRTDKSEHVTSTATSSESSELENENKANSNVSKSVALRNHTKTPVIIYRETGTSPIMNLSKRCITLSDYETNSNDKNEYEDNADNIHQNENENESTEHKLIVQERLNVRLTAQLKAWVDAQINIHAKLADDEATQILDQKFHNNSKSQNINDANLQNDIRNDQCLQDKVINEKSICENYGNDDVSYDSNIKKQMELKSKNNIEGKLLEVGSWTNNSMLSASPSVLKSLPVIRTLFKDMDGKQNNNNDDKMINNDSGNRILQQKYNENNIVVSSPQYSHLLLVENNYEDDNNCSLISDYSYHINQMINSTQKNSQKNNLYQASNIFNGHQNFNPSTPLINKMLKNDDISIKNNENKNESLSTKSYSSGSKISLKSPSLQVTNITNEDKNGIVSALSPLQEKLLRLNNSSRSNSDDKDDKNKIMKNIRKSNSPKSKKDEELKLNEKNEYFSQSHAGEGRSKGEGNGITGVKVNEHNKTQTTHDNSITHYESSIHLPRTYAESLSTVPTPLKTSETPGKIFGKLLAKKTPTHEKSPRKSPFKIRNSLTVSEGPHKITDINQNTEYSTNQKYGYESKTEFSEYQNNNKTDSETMSKNEGFSNNKNNEYGNIKNNTFTDKRDNVNENGNSNSNGGIAEYRSLLETDSYLNLPVGRRAISRERGAATITQKKSSQLQAKLR